MPTLVRKRPATGRDAGRRTCRWRSFCRALQGRVVRFTRTDADDTVDVGDEDLAVAHLAGLRGLEDGFDVLIDEVAANGHFDLGLRDEVDDVFGATIQLGMTALATETLQIGRASCR